MIQAALKFEADSYPAGFWRWMESNQHVYDRFEELALSMARNGRKHYSARAILHVIRWETHLRDSDSTFKVNNNYTPGMARLFNEKHGEKYPNFFRCRDSRGMDV